MSVKVKFHMAMEAGPDPKTNVKNIKSIQRLDDLTTYSFPSECQLSSTHLQLSKNPTIARGLGQLSRRGQSRTLAVTLNENLYKLYFDEEGNVCFNNTYLDEIVLQQDPQGQSLTTQKKSLKSLTKDMVIEKFTGKSQNANSWIISFEKECRRLEINQSQFAETLRLCLEGSALEWYSINLKLVELTAPWETWKVEFLDNFTSKGWSDVTYAYTFKYYSGSLSEYAFKKINLLLEADPTLSVTSRINFVVIGLPNFIKDRLNKSDIESQADLISELNNLESFVNRHKGKSQYVHPRKNNNENSHSSQDKNPLRKDYYPCPLCEKAGFLNRYHKETDCWYHPDNKDKKPNSNQKSKSIKVANNIELQQALNEIIPDTKN